MLENGWCSRLLEQGEAKKNASEIISEGQSAGHDPC
jgi:hypothetical protein